MPAARLTLVLATGLLTCSTLAVAQDDGDLTRTPWRGGVLLDQWRRAEPDSPVLHVPDRITRDEQVERVTLKDAVALALANNPGIAAQRLEPVRREQEILRAQGVYDPTLAGELNYAKSETPNASSLAGTRTLNVDDRTADFHLFKTFRTGTRATIDFLNERLDSNARFNQLRPAYTANLNFSLVQPLLQSFGWDFSYLVVRVAEQSRGASSTPGALSDFVEQYRGVLERSDARERRGAARVDGARRRTVRERGPRAVAFPAGGRARARADARPRAAACQRGELARRRRPSCAARVYSPGRHLRPRNLEPSGTRPKMSRSTRRHLTRAARAAGDKRIGEPRRGGRTEERIAGNGSHRLDSSADTAERPGGGTRNVPSVDVSFIRRPSPKAPRRRKGVGCEVVPSGKYIEPDDQGELRHPRSAATLHGPR